MGVKPAAKIFIFAVIGPVLALSACVSAPIDMAGQNKVELQAIDSQFELRQSAKHLAAHVENAGWSLTQDASAATRSMIGRLIGGADQKSKQQDPAVQAVNLYLAERSELSSILTDVSALTETTHQVSHQVLRVASSQSALDVQALNHDIAVTERALGAVRRAKQFFHEIGRKAALAEDEENRFQAELTRLASAEAGLALSADALAERRWAIRHGAIS